MPLFSPYDGPPLFEQLLSIENVLAAWQRVKRNIQVARRSRSAGVDEITLRDFEADLARQLDTLVDELRSGRYRPLPPISVSIPKRSGGARAIAILAVRDRVVQRAVQQVLEPVFDPYLLDCSYGCRPRVGVVDALKRVERYAAQGLTWVVDADVADYFDRLDRRILLGLVRQRVAEVPLLRLIAQLLEAGACATAETAALVEGRPGGLALFRRGVAALQRIRGGERAPLSISPPLVEPDPYAADAWERPAGWTGLAGSDLGRGFGAARMAEHTPINTLWSLYLLAQPLGGVARQFWPQLRRLGPQRLLAAGGAAAGTLALAELVLRWQQAAPRGTAQGGALSPLLANIYLHPFDVALSSQGVRLVRFMDDFVIMCASEEEARRALALVEQQLATLRLSLNPAKTRIVDYSEGLEFLGQALAPPRRGARLTDGVSSFEEAQARLRTTAQQVRRRIKR